MEKRIFNHSPTEIEEAQIVESKKEFQESTAQIRPDEGESLEGELLTGKIEQALRPKPRWWKKVLGATALLFGGAVIAQSVQWIIDTWQQNQWIYFAFSLVGFSVVVVGLSALIREWRRLLRLRYLDQHKQEAEQLLLESAQSAQDDSEKGKALCLDIAKNMQLSPQDPAVQKWQSQLSDAHSAQETAYLFSQNVLRPRDKLAQKLISKSAAEATVIVAVSPLALVDMFFVAWRNIRLVNRIADIYGIELGYFSRLRLMRMILLNIAFAGASELIHDIGMDWLSQDLTAKLSARAAQGIGVGLLTARLGIKTMEFCRPLAFQKDEKPRLSLIHRELLTTLKATVLNGGKVKQPQSDYQ